MIYIIYIVFLYLYCLTKNIKKKKQAIENINKTKSYSLKVYTNATVIEQGKNREDPDKPILEIKGGTVMERTDVLDK